MFLRKTLLATAVAAAALTSSVAFAAGKQDFTLTNKTGYVINEVYVSPSQSDDWQNDVLGQDTLDNGQTVHIKFSRATQACEWDLKVTYTDGESAEWNNFNLCEVSKIRIFYTNGETSAEYE